MPTPIEVGALKQTDTIPSMHSTKPPGIASLDVARDGDLILTGGCVAYLRVAELSQLTSSKQNGQKFTSVQSSLPAKS